MTRRERIGLGIFRTLTAMAAAATVLALLLAYTVSRHCDSIDDAVGWLGATFIFLVAPTVAVAIGVAFGARSFYRSRLQMEIVLWCIVILVAAYCAGGAVGTYRSLEELGRSRALADLVVAEVRTYHNEHGKYPEKLSDSGRSLPTQLCRHNEVLDLQYSRSDANGFTLTYSCGWIVCTYDSKSSGWYEETD
ncbi:MAG: hypothetical protein ABIF82_00240 [Planctomycetota bacterium]